MAKTHETRSRLICGKTFTKRDAFPGTATRPAVIQKIQGDDPALDRSGYICQQDLASLDTSQIRKRLVSEKGELTSPERTVIENLRKTI